MKIVVDTREQDPLEFIGESVPGTLSTGDYSLLGLEDHISIERKSLSDLLGSMTSGRDRFERELQRGKAYDYFAVVIESNFETLASGTYRSKMNPTSAVASILAFSVRYNVPIFFCGDKSHTATIVEGLLRQYRRQLEKKMTLIQIDLDNIKREEAAKTHLF